MRKSYEIKLIIYFTQKSHNNILYLIKPIINAIGDV